MFKMIMKRRLEKNKKKGFTLIELIVVIVIIAIIAAIAVPALTRYIESANVRAAQAMAHNIQVVLQAEVTDFYNSDPFLSIPTSGSPFFETNVPAKYPDGVTDFVNTPAGILLNNGVVLLEGSTLETITFLGKRLTGFSYTHTNGTTVIFDNGKFI